jgi:hypothetical protein
MRNGLPIGLVSCLAAISLIVTASPAAASQTIGRLAPTPSASCTGSTTDWIEPTVTSGVGYVVPTVPDAPSLVISSWSHNAANAPGPLTFKVFRKVADPATYTVIAHDGPRLLTPSALNTFPVDIPVQPGDVIGINSAIPASTACNFFDMTENPLIRSGDIADGESGDFGPQSEKDVNVSAVVSPSNRFSLKKGKAKSNGTATLIADVPNPGTISVGGKGVKAAQGNMNVAPGTVKLTVSAKGKQRAKLIRRGKVKISPSVSFTPAGGDSDSESRKLNLRL